MESVASPVSPTRQGEILRHDFCGVTLDRARTRKARQCHHSINSGILVIRINEPARSRPSLMDEGKDAIDARRCAIVNKILDGSGSRSNNENPICIIRAKPKVHLDNPQIFFVRNPLVKFGLYSTCESRP